LRKPPYKVYSKKRREEESPIQIPEKIDTPQAEQLVSDFYKLLHFLSQHKKKLLGLLAALIIIGGSFGAYSYYLNQVELKAAELVDRGLYYLDAGKKEKALKLLSQAVSKYPQAPSSRLASFILGKLNQDVKYLKELSLSDSYLLSPPSRSSLLALRVDGKFNGSVKPVERQEWTHPEYLYGELLVALKEGNRKKAKELLDSIVGDYPGYPISDLDKGLVE
jgi:tetratricopeptide (TPR) repeat protein